uniref:Protein SPT2 homolog n=1 Tax=Syphacia muris TaxID=451379 RepID=A0A0N5AYR7_9BILA
MVTQETKLSNVLLEMKFMQRTKLRLQREEERKQERKLENSYLHNKGSSTASRDRNKRAIKEEPTTSKKVKYVFEANSNELEDQMFGRMSFQGFNPEIEEVMKYYKGDSDEIEMPDDTLDGKDVGDYEMAGILRGGGSEKGSTKQEHLNEGRTFIDESCWSAGRQFRMRQDQLHRNSRSNRARRNH